MQNFETNWTDEELKCYILIFSAHANFKESKEEKKFIISQTHLPVYKKMHLEFKNDNDYQSIQKIRLSVEKHGYNKSEIERLFTEIKEMFLTDGEVDILEENLYNGLHHILADSI